MPFPPEILDSIHEVELRLTDARRKASKGRLVVGVQVATWKRKHPCATSESTQLDSIGVLTRQLATLWGQYREMKQT